MNKFDHDAEGVCLALRCGEGHEVARVVFVLKRDRYAPGVGGDETRHPLGLLPPECRSKKLRQIERRTLGHHGMGPGAWLTFMPSLSSSP
jgi:hypothetical protein